MPGGVRERPNRHAWKACVGKLTVGSNPTLSAGEVQLEPQTGAVLKGGSHRVPAPPVAPRQLGRSVGAVTTTVTTWPFASENTFVRDLDGLFVPWEPAGSPEPRLLALNDDLAAELGFDPDALRSADGLALLVISSELEELVGYADRVIIMRDRQQVAEIPLDKLSVPAIMNAIAA